MDIDTIIDVVWKLGTLMGFIWMYLANRDKVTNGRISGLEDAMNTTLSSHSSRLASLEKDMANSPDHADLGKIYERMSGLEHRLGDRIENINGAVKRIEGENAAQTRILNLVYESLTK